MESTSVAARQHLEELERRRQERSRPAEPLWLTSAWILTWLTFTTSTVLMGGSDWIFLVYAVTTAIFGALFYAQRRRGSVRVWSPMTTRQKYATVLALLVTIGVFAICVRYETPWPLVALNVVATIGMFVEARREAHPATPLQDER